MVHTVYHTCTYSGTYIRTYVHAYIEMLKATESCINLLVAVPCSVVSIECCTLAAAEWS